MTPEAYQERMAALGIERGALAAAAEFEEDRPLGNGAIGHEPTYVNRRAGLRVRRDTLGLPVEDLTHLNPKWGAEIARLVSERAARRREARKGAGA